MVPDLPDDSHPAAGIDTVFHEGSASAPERAGLPVTIEASSSAAAKEFTERPVARALPRQLPDYEILGELGRGGMGVVFKARQISLNRTVALKMIPAGALAGATTLARFHVEAEALASLQHPNIVAVFEVGEFESCPYLVTEFLDGGSLAQRLVGQPQPPRAAASLVETLAHAIHCAHQRGIVHRDLKPGNVILHGVEPSSTIPKIIDFGLAKRLAEDKGQTATGSIVGTPSYMAPEQASGQVADIGPPADIYALGAILYEMLTGRPPFLGKSGMETINRVVRDEPVAPTQICHRVPRDLETICLKCLHKAPAGRYPTAEALANDLRRFLDGKPITARPAGVVERTVKWVRRRPALATLIAVIFVATFVLAGSLVWSYTRVLKERDHAHRSLQTARKAVDDLYTKMATERLFDEPQLDPLCQELLEKAQVLYEDLARENSDDPEVRRDIALAWFRLGDIHRIRGHQAEAEQGYLEAIERQEALARDRPAIPRFRQDLANSHNWLGELLRENGRLEDAERHYRVAMELQRELVNKFPSDEQYRQELARTHYNLGIIERDTDHAATARADADRAIDLLTELHQSKPSEANVRQDLARALINRGVLHRAGNRFKDAQRDYQQAIDLLTGLRHEFSTRAAYKFELALARRDIGNLLWSQERYADAQRAAEEALSLLESLVTDFSTRPDYKKKMGNTLKDLGAVLASRHDFAAADRCLSRARTIFDELVQQFPESADYQALLGMTLGNLGWLRTEQGNWKDARQFIELGMASMRNALTVNSQSRVYKWELRSQCQDLAETMINLKDHAGACKAAKELATVFPDIAQDAYNAACFVARSVPLALADNDLGNRPARQSVADGYIDTAIALLRQAVPNASPSLKRLANENQVFDPLQGHRDFGRLMERLDAKTKSDGD